MNSICRTFQARSELWISFGDLASRSVFTCGLIRTRSARQQPHFYQSFRIAPFRLFKKIHKTLVDRSKKVKFLFFAVVGCQRL